MKTVIYARQSLDRHGDTLAVSRQLDLCRAFANKRGWTVDAEMVDNDRSATSGANRPEFERLLTARPDRVIVWHTDRLVRLTRDLERVIDLGADVHAVEAGHLDLSNPAGRAVARTVTAWATYEGEQKAARQRASNDQRAAAGKPAAGRRTYGYTADGMALVEDEAEHTRTAARALIQGTPLRTIVRRLNDDGVVTSMGKPWTATSFRRYLQLPRLAGLRVHRGEIVGKGQWPAILTEDEHASVVAVLSDPTRRPKGRPRTYLLSGVARCGTCGAKIYGRVERRGPIYVCESHAHLGRKVADIDAYIEAVIVARLALPDAARAFAQPDHADRAETLHAERRTLTARLDELAEAFAAGSITGSQMTTATARLRDRLDAIEAELPTLVGTPALGAVVSAEDVSAAWDALDTDIRREIIGILATVRLLPAGRGARHFDPDTVTIEWRMA